MSGRPHPGDPCPEEPVETFGEGASPQGPCFPIACALGTNPLPPAHSFPGLTSFLWRPGLHLLGLLALDGAQRQHHGTTGAPCRQDTEQLVPGRWSWAAWVWLSDLGWTQQLHPLPRLQVPSIQGHMLPMPPAGFLQGPGCDLGTAVVMAPGEDKGRARGTWGSPPFKTRTTVTRSAGTRKLQLS